MLELSKKMWLIVIIAIVFGLLGGVVGKVTSKDVYKSEVAFIVNTLSENEAVENCQVPLVLSESKNGFSYQDFQSGSDLQIVDADDNILPFEIECWDPSGKSIVWVKVPNFSKDTKLKLRKKNAH